MLAETSRGTGPERASSPGPWLTVHETRADAGQMHDIVEQPYTNYLLIPPAAGDGDYGDYPLLLRRSKGRVGCVGKERSSSPRGPGK